MSGQRLRTGLGFDTHPHGEHLGLALGGVAFPDARGLDGHSDADVLCHAVADGLLGACALGDLGDHFPDTDPTYAGIAGLDLLARVVAVLAERDAVPVACDATVIAEQPKLGDARMQMRENIARVLGVDIDEVSVKATRPEGLGLVGDGVGCLAVVTVAR